MTTPTKDPMRKLWELLEAGDVAVTDLSRDALIRLCVWNDRNGCFTDEDCIAEGLPVCSHETLVTIVTTWIAESK